MALSGLPHWSGKSSGISGFINQRQALKAKAVKSSFMPLMCSVSPASSSNHGAGSSQTSNPYTASSSGGSGSVTFLWIFVSGDGSTTADTGTLATTTFTCGGLANDEVSTSNWRCQVTDTITGEIVFTTSVIVTLSRDSALAPINVTVSPTSSSQTRTGVGTITFGFSGSADHTYTASNWSISGDMFEDSETDPNIVFHATLTSPGQNKSGTVTFNVFDSVTGRSGSSSPTPWSATAT